MISSPALGPGRRSAAVAVATALLLLATPAFYGSSAKAGSGISVGPSADKPVDQSRVLSASATSTATPTAKAVATAGVTRRPSATPTSTAPASGGDPVIVGAGDICITSEIGNAAATAALIEARPSGSVFTLGDNSNESGTAANYANCYAPTWGAFLNRTHAVAGNHDYLTAGAAPYYAYFGAAAGPAGKGYYSYNLANSWHVIVLNSQCSEVGGCSAGSPQETWLRADLAASAGQHIIAIWHIPAFSSGGVHGNDANYLVWWQDLCAAHADLILDGHDHDYERFGLQSPTAAADPNGIREFVVGTGGAGQQPFGTIRANSQVRNEGTFGVLELTLHAQSYDWQFIPIAGGTFTDSGTQATHSGTQATPSTYVPLNPTRILDTRTGNGLAGKFSAGVPRTFQVTGRGGVPSNATAVTGNLTVTGQTSGWAVFLGPNPNPNPTSSTINFSAGEVRANGVTVALSHSGTLSATYISTSGNTTDLVFDVTGYFTPENIGATYTALTPARLLDTRSGIGSSGRLTAGVPRSFQVTGRGGVPANATAVTGNLTITDQTSGWAVFLGPDPNPSPGTSAINFTAGEVRANGVTVALSPSGSLSATYLSTAGQTTNLVFDVTGYFTPDSSGAMYVPLSPSRILDTRTANGLSGPFVAGTPRTFNVTGRGGVPTNAIGVTGNLTVTDQNQAWAVFLGPNPTPSPTTSTVNFSVGQVIANGVTVALGSGGTLSATYMSTSGNTTSLVFDVTGYFAP